MRKKIWYRLLSLAVTATLLLGMAAPAAAGDSSVAADEGSRRTPLSVEKVDNASVSAHSGQAERNTILSQTAQQEPDPDEMVRVSIILKGASTIAAGYSTLGIAGNSKAMRYRTGLLEAQTRVQTAIESSVLHGQALDVVWNLTLAANLISANIRRGDIAAVEAIPGVAAVVEECQYEPAVISTGGEYEPSMALAGDMVGAQAAWDAGYTGAGSLIAIIDTGLDTDHQSFDSGAFDYAIEELESSGETVDLLTREEVAAAMATGWLNLEVDPDQLYVSSKVPFGYNYVDHNYDITHDNDYQGEHGSHVAGIAAANRYVEVDGEYKDALETVATAGNAPDAQLLIMKVFGMNGGAFDSDCVAAIEDAIILGADAVNLSMGTMPPGNSVPAAGSYYADIVNELVNSDTVVAYAAGNNGVWPENTYQGSLYNDGVNYQTTTEPSTYTNVLSVASVDNAGLVRPYLDANGKSYDYAEDTQYGNPAIRGLDTEGDGTEYEFVMIDTVDGTSGGGNEEEALAKIADEVRGKVAILWRGTTSFLEKAAAAEKNGAIAVIVANNTEGAFGMDLTGYTGKIPVVAISQAAGQEIWKAGESGGDGYVTGPIVIYSNVKAFPNDPGYYTMSSFSSWGTPGGLTVKPEITAPGGNIYSVNGAIPGGHDYEVLSGTSMATPQVAGLAALVQQYLRDADNGITVPTHMTSRALTQSLLMSTAVPLKDSNGQYYPVLQQGSGLANVNAAVSSPAYITVDGQADGKVKVELGDDPTRAGSYTMEFDIHNMTADARTYEISLEAFTQAYFSNEDGEFLDTSTRPLDVDVDVQSANLVSSGLEDLRYDFNGDGTVDSADAQLLLDYAVKGTAIEGFPDSVLDLDHDFDVDTHDAHVLMKNIKHKVTVEDVTHVTVTFTLTEEEAATLKAQNPNGAYIEAYIFATPEADEEGALAPTLSIPVLGFYGNWSDSDMFAAPAREWYFKEFEKTPQLYGSFYYTVNSLLINDQIVLDGASISGTEPAELSLWYSLNRGAGNCVIRITNSANDEVWWSEDLGPKFGPYFNYQFGIWEGDLGILDSIDWSPVGLPAGTEIEFTMIAAPEYYAKYDYDWEALTDGDDSNGELGKGAYLTTTLVVDDEAPEVLVGDDLTYSEVDEDGKRHVYLSVSDDVSVYRVTLYGADGERLAYEYGPNVYQVLGDEIWGNFKGTSPATGPDEVFKAEFDGYYEPDEVYAYYTYDNLYIYKKVADLDDTVYLVQVEDAAGNVSTYRLFAGVEPTDTTESVEISREEIEMVKGTTKLLSAAAMPMTLKDRSLTWTSSDPSIATVDSNGLVTAVGLGEATITATANTRGANDYVVSADCQVTVIPLTATATGVLSDSEGNGKFFTWDLETGKMTTGDDVAQYPMAITDAGAGDGTFYLSNNEGTFLMDASGEVKEGPWDWGFYRPWTMTASERGIHWAYYMNVFINQQPGDLEIGTVITFSTASLYGLAVKEGEWQVEYVDETGENVSVSGDYMFYAIDANNDVWEVMMYEEEQGLSYLYRSFPSDLAGNPEPYQNEEYVMSTYCNLVIGEDGALYYAETIDGSTKLYRLVFNEEYEIWESALLGDAETWPALLLSVKNKAPAQTPDTASYDATGWRMAKAETIDAAAFANSVPSRPAVTGTLNQIKDIGSNDSTGSAIKVDNLRRTISVPVYALESTNGEFTLGYDADLLTLDRVTAGSSVLISYEEGTSGVIHAGYAGEEALNQAALTAYFSYDADAIGSDVTFTLSVTQDGNAKETAESSCELTIPEDAQMPVLPFVPGNPTTPSEPAGPTPTAPTAKDFADLDPGAWYYDDVSTVIAAGLMNGTGGSTFEPQSNLQRGMLATILYRLCEEPEGAWNMSFTDVSDGLYYSDAVAWAAANGIVTGRGEGIFAPGDNITRQELAVMLWHLAQFLKVDVNAGEIAIPAFTDSGKIASWAGEAVSWACRTGILQGKGGNVLDPTGTATRAEVCTMLTRFVNSCSINWPQK